MQKRIVVAGCRDYTNYEQAKQYIEWAISKGTKSMISETKALNKPIKVKNIL